MQVHIQLQEATYAHQQNKASKETKIQHSRTGYS